jgi:para-nitrobenzyl esterase
MENQAEITINTGLGSIKGLQLAGHQDFLGIRYALAPVGDLRFIPPRRLDSWEETYNATHYGPAAPQSSKDEGILLIGESEDCLLLNIHTPKADDKARTVMVYFHGGGYDMETCSRPLTYGGPLAEAGDVVVVTIQYRLGALGFLYMDGVSPNLGLQDQVCALEWVHQHIADFGGDPHNVTIFGESAGAASVSYLLVMPSAKDLFHKAIMESGVIPIEPEAVNYHNASSGAKRFLKQLKIKNGSLVELQHAPCKNILKAQKIAASQTFSTSQSFYPVIDGVVIPRDVYGRLRSGCSADIPIIMGINAEELPIFMLGALMKFGLLKSLIRARMTSHLKKDGITSAQIKRLVGLYKKVLPAGLQNSNRVYNHLFSDEHFRIPETLFIEAHIAGGGRAYHYNFSHPDPKLGIACHVLELCFVFGTLTTQDLPKMISYPGTAEELRLSQTMMAAWTSFARNGNPNAPGLPEWIPYDPDRRAVMDFDLESRIVYKPAEAIRCAWMEIGELSFLRKA